MIRKVFHIKSSDKNTHYGFLLMFTIFIFKEAPWGITYMYINEPMLVRPIFTYNLIFSIFIPSIKDFKICVVK